MGFAVYSALIKSLAISKAWDWHLSGWRFLALFCNMGLASFCKMWDEGTSTRERRR
jgi:hypothetical protein